MVAQCADQQTDSDDAVRGDHDGGEDGISWQRRRVRPAGQHNAQDQADLDDRDCDGKDKRAEGLVDAVRNHLRVVHRNEHSCDQSYADQQQECGWQATVPHRCGER